MGYREHQAASQSRPCPICQKTDWCFLTVDSEEGLIRAICGRPASAPEGWRLEDREAKDGRKIYSKGDAKKANRRKFAQVIDWEPRALPPGPEWAARKWEDGQAFGGGDRVWMAGKLYTVVGYGNRGVVKIRGESGGESEVFADGLVPAIADGDAKELEIWYAYEAQGKPVGRVRRRQWSDRRPWYEKDSLKSKEIRPFFASKTTDPQEPWVWRWGKGEQLWPLYREEEALDEIERGGVVLVVAGEQAVEIARGLGFVACCPSGGERRQGDIVTALKPALQKAQDARKRPFLALWPDLDPTGEDTWRQLQRTCNNQQLLAATLMPTEIWADMPIGGDIHDLWRGWRGDKAKIRAAIVAGIEAAIDRQERILQAEDQRRHWGAPEAKRGELGFTVIQELKKREREESGEEFKEVWKPKTDFNFSIRREMVGADGGGLLLALTLADYPGERLVRLATDDCSSKAAFQKAITRGLGRNVVCNLKDDQLQALLRVRLLEYRLFEGGASYKLIDRIGKQADGHWVFKDRQFDPTGTESSENRSGWIWNESLTDNDQAFKAPSIVDPNSQAIKDWAIAGRRFFGSNWPIVLLTAGYVAAACHYDRIMSAEDSFPILNLYGDAGSGKTMSARYALALVGQHNEGIMAKVSISAIYERLQGAGGLAHCLDDPERDDSLADFFKALYNAKTRVVRGRDGKKFASQTPHSPLFMTSNMALGEDHQAARSRLCKIFVPQTDGDKLSYPLLEQAMGKASGCFPDLVALAYDPDKVRGWEAMIRPLLEKAHDRIPRSFALVLGYATEIATLAEDDADVFGYCIEHVFPRLNILEEGGDSLCDFVERVSVLVTEGLLGAWNVRPISKLGSRSLALHLPSVWAVVEQRNKLPYDLSNLKAVIGAKGGNLSGSQQFHSDKNESLTALRDGRRPNMRTSRCVEIPWEAIAQVADFDFEGGGF